MKVLLYSRTYPPAIGGMERFAQSMATWLAEQGHGVTVLTNSPGGERDDLPVLRAPSWPDLVRAVRSADVVHVNGLSLRGITVARTCRRPVVMTHAQHEAVCPTGFAWSPSGRCTAGPSPGPCAACPERGLRGRLQVALHGAGTKHVARNVTISQYLDRRLGLPRSECIYNPLAPGAPASSQVREHRLVAFVGRLVPEKGLDPLLHALVLLPDVRLEVAGDGPQRQTCEGLARTLGVGHRVVFRGWLDLEGVRELHARAAVACVPSACFEPFGYAAAEAMQSGSAVVATPNGALSELLADGRGWIAEDGSPRAIAAALREAFESEQRRTEVGDRGRVFARRQLGIDVIGPRYVRLYTQVAGS